MRAHRVYLGIFVLFLAPIGTVVVMTLLLVMGVAPPLVFAPGRAVRWLFERCGIEVANRVPVAATALFYWAIFVGLGLLWEWRRHRRRS